MSSSTSSRELDEMKRKFIQSESGKLDKVKTLLDTIKSLVEEDKKKEEEVRQIGNPRSMEDFARRSALESDLLDREIKSFKNIATIENFNSGDSTSNMTIQIQLYEIKMNPRDLDNYDDQKVTENLIEIFDLDKCFINQFSDMEEEIKTHVKKLKEKIKELENGGPEVENDLKELKEELSQYQFTEEETYYLHMLHVENGTPDDYNELSKVLNLKKMSEDENLKTMKKKIIKFGGLQDTSSKEKNFTTSTRIRYMETFILEHHDTRTNSQWLPNNKQPLEAKLKKWTPQDDLYCLKPGCVHYKIQGTTMDIASLYLRNGTGTHSGATTVDNVTFNERDLPDILRISDKVSNLRIGYKALTGKNAMYLHHFNKCNVIPIDIVDTRIYLLTPTLFFKPYTELTEQISKFITTENLKEVLERDTQTLFALKNCSFQSNGISFYGSFNWRQFMKISNYFNVIPNLENLEKSPYRDIIFRYDLKTIKSKKDTPFSFLMDLKATYLKENDDNNNNGKREPFPESESDDDLILELEEEEEGEGGEDDNNNNNTNPYDLRESYKRQREQAEKHRQELAKHIEGFDNMDDFSSSEDDNNNNEDQFAGIMDANGAPWAFDTEDEKREKEAKKKKKKRTTTTTTTTTTTRSRNDKRKRTKVDDMEKIGEAIETLFQRKELNLFLQRLLIQCKRVKTVNGRQKCIDFLNLVLLYCWVTFVNPDKNTHLMNILYFYIDEISVYLSDRLDLGSTRTFSQPIDKLNFVFKNFRNNIIRYVNFTEDIKTWEKLIDEYDEDDPISDEEKEKIKKFVRDHYKGPL